MKLFIGLIFTFSLSLAQAHYFECKDPVSFEDFELRLTCNEIGWSNGAYLIQGETQTHLERDEFYLDWITLTAVRIIFHSEHTPYHRTYCILAEENPECN